MGIRGNAISTENLEGRKFEALGVGGRIKELRDIR
jgi:hypothetical protein